MVNNIYIQFNYLRDTIGFIYKIYSGHLATTHR